MKKITSVTFIVFLLAISTILLLDIRTSRAQFEVEKQVLITTPYGNIRIKLYNDTPKHRDNFLKLVNAGFYDSTLFHRVISGFMIQGGDPNSKTAKPEDALGMGGPGYTIPAEILPQYYHKKGALAAARMPDFMNPNKESSGSQFYIVQGTVYTEDSFNSLVRSTGKQFTSEQQKTYMTIGGTPQLDGDYTVFGEVVEGLDVIEKIASVITDRNDRPREDIRITMKIVE